MDSDLSIAIVEAFVGTNHVISLLTPLCPTIRLGLQYRDIKETVPSPQHLNICTRVTNMQISVETFCYIAFIFT